MAAELAELGIAAEARTAEVRTPAEVRILPQSACAAEVERAGVVKFHAGVAGAAVVRTARAAELAFAALVGVAELDAAAIGAGEPVRPGSSVQLGSAAQVGIAADLGIAADSVAPGCVVAVASSSEAAGKTAAEAAGTVAAGKTAVAAVSSSPAGYSHPAPVEQLGADCAVEVEPGEPVLAGKGPAGGLFVAEGARAFGSPGTARVGAVGVAVAQSPAVVVQTGYASSAAATVVVGDTAGREAAAAVDNTLDSSCPLRAEQSLDDTALEETGMISADWRSPGSSLQQRTR